MSEWVDRLAEDLGEEPLTEEETTTLLAVSRDVAHRVERRITPLSTFLAGTAVGRSMAGGATRDDALRATLASLESILPEAPPEPSS